VQSARQLALIASLAAIAVASRMALAALPNIKIVAFLVLMAGVIGGRRVGLLVGIITVLTSDVLMFGVGIWTFSDAAGMGFLGVAAGFLWSKRKLIPSKLELGVMGYLLTLVYDVFTSIVSPYIIYLMAGDVSFTLTALVMILAGLFIPLGGFLYPPGPAHELVTALLLALAGPMIITRVRSMRLRTIG
jgi:uncharacterized membrane protein